MIFQKMFSCFNLVEIEGECIAKIIPGDMGVLKISASSKKYNSDLEALDNLEKIISNFSSGEIGITEKFDVNPEFLPSANTMYEADIEPVGDKTNRVMVSVSRNFDDIGDYVQFRKVVSGDHVKITGRVLANPVDYVQFKADLATGEPSVGKQVSNNVIH
jgi:hypothetical protein